MVVEWDALWHLWLFGDNPILLEPLIWNYKYYWFIELCSMCIHIPHE